MWAIHEDRNDSLGSACIVDDLTGKINLISNFFIYFCIVLLVSPFEQEDESIDRPDEK